MSPATVFALVVAGAAIPPPMFSPEYVEAVRGVLEMEAPEAQSLERQVLAEPGAWTKRLRLLAYYMRADQRSRPESLRRRGRHVLWLIERQPQSEILSSPYGQLEPGVLTPEQEEAAGRLWDKALAAGSSSARVFWNAAQFFRERNQEASLRFLREAARLEPGNWHYGFGLGVRYGGKLVAALQAGRDSEASATLRELEATKNPAVLEPVVRMLQGEYDRSRMMGREQPVFRDKARELFAKLETLNPKVDRAWVMPPAPQAGAPPAPPPRKPVRRLKPEDFPELPSGVAALLQARGCTIPQPELSGPNRNVIRGEFFERGKTGWAVLCSRAGKSSILVFRSDADNAPDEIAESEDIRYLADTGQGWMSYSRLISPADRKLILTHYRAYGGPEPPPIDHHGVDDAFLEKASITWYRHRGKWLQLQGAD